MDWASHLINVVGGRKLASSCFVHAHSVVECPYYIASNSTAANGLSNRDSEETYIRWLPKRMCFFWLSKKQGTGLPRCLSSIKSGGPRRTLEKNNAKNPHKLVARSLFIFSTPYLAKWAFFVCEPPGRPVWEKPQTTFKWAFLPW
jgi:hypothetical protein